MSAVRTRKAVAGTLYIDGASAILGVPVPSGFAIKVVDGGADAFD